MKLFRLIVTSLVLLILLSLIACGSSGSSDVDNGTTNQAPTANAGNDQSVEVNNQVNISGAGSSDPDGDNLSYSWSITSQPSGSSSQLSASNGVSPTLTPDSAGDYVVQLVVNDGTVDSPADSMIITATEPAANQAPVANAGINQAVTRGTLVNLSGAASSDPEGASLTYQWTLATRPNGSLAELSSSNLVNPTFTADVDGEYQIELIVNDGELDSTVDSLTVTASASSGGGANATTATGIDVHATFHNIGVQVDFTGDENNNATAFMEANINGAGFQPVHDLSKVFLVVSQYGDYPERFVGSVLSVPEEAEVEVRVTINDPDGVTNGIQTATITARSREIPTPTGNQIHVAKNGDDITGDGSIGSPYLTIQRGINELSIGDTLLIHAGTYHENLMYTDNQISATQAYTTIKSAGDGEVILSGTDDATLEASAWTDEGNDVYSAPLISPDNETYYVGFNGNRMWKYFSLSSLQNLSQGTDGGFYSESSTQKIYVKLPGNVSPTGNQISVSNLKYALEMYAVNNVVIDGLTFDNFNSGEHSASIHLSDDSNNLWIVNSTFLHMETPIRLEQKVTDLVVMGNDFSDQGIQVFDWDNIKENQYWLERGALFCSNDEYSGSGIIFYDNDVHEMFDGIKITGQEILSYASNSDVYGNRFIQLSDDGTETDGYASNVRIQNNRYERMLIGVSVAPALAGPTYINYNEMVDLQNIAFTDYATGAVKFSVGGDKYGDIFIYHNTGTTTEAGREAFSVSNDADWTKLVMKNNIWSGESYGIYYYLNNADVMDWTMEYDLLFASSGLAAQYQGEDYADIDDFFTASGVCENCIEGAPSFIDQSGGDYRLNSNSPAIDVGVLIPGVNALDANGNLPDIGANQFVE